MNTASTLQPSEKQVSAWHAWFILVVTSLFFFFEYGLNNIFNSLEEPVRHAYQLSSVEIGWIASMYFYANIVALIPAAILLDRFSPRVLLTIAMLVCATGVLAVAETHSVVVLVIARLIMGLGGGFCVIGCMRVAVNWFHSAQMARAASVVVAIGMLGGFLVQTPMTLLINHQGWRSATAVVAMLGYAIALLIFVLVRDVPACYAHKNRQRHAQLAELGLSQSIKIVFSQRQNWACAIFASTINLPIYILGALWGVPYLMFVHHFTNTEASIIASMLFLGTLVGGLLVGSISDMIGRRKAPMLVGVLLSIGLIFFILQSNGDFMTLIMLFFLLGFTTSVEVLSYPTVAESNSRMVASTATSILSISFMLMGAIGQPLFGKILEQGWSGAMINGVPVYSAQSYQVAIGMLPIAFVISLLAVLFVKDTYCQRLVE